MNIPIFTKSIYKSESLKVIDFCVKKFNLKDSFQLNDKFEGRQYLENLLVKYIINKMIFEDVFGNDNIDFNKLVTTNYNDIIESSGLSFKTVMDVLMVYDNLSKYDLILCVNINALKVNIYSKNENIISMLKKNINHEEL
tara:strand:+ start:209 stop:628 length:420 start_codon:yes stop_codon:yes gene_type:complete